MSVQIEQLPSGKWKVIAGGVTAICNTYDEVRAVTKKMGYRV